MSRKKYHITFDKSDSKWRLKKEKSFRATSVFDTKEEAVKSAKKIVKSKPPSQLIIHKKDGVMQTEYTYKEDPYPPRG